MREVAFEKGQSLHDYQQLMKTIYTRSGDRLFSVSDLVAQQQRFTMRALKGIRKNDKEKLRRNLLIAFCWGMAIPNRYELDIDNLVWNRFPMMCSYCGRKPCACKKLKPKTRAKITKNNSERPGSIRQMQDMFEAIYPAKSRTLEHAGVHLAEEVGEVSEAVHAHMAEHKKRQIGEIKEEVADFISCIFGVANSAGIDIEKESVKMFANNCYICHHLPCTCTMAFINKFKS